ncbi:MAG TPA: hypothetical protein VIW29_03495, partial [Polyangiaceae bacterium]
MPNRGILMVALSCCLVPSAHAAGAITAESNTATSRTLRSGAVLEFSGDTKYELGDTVELQLEPTGHDKTMVQVLKLSAGRVSVRIPEGKQTAVMIQGPRKVSAIVKGGEGVVIATSERVTVAAVRGEMRTALGNDWKPLASGVVRSFAGGTAVEQPLPVTPKLSATQTVLLALQGGASTTVQAAPSANVEHRNLTLYRLDGARRTLLSDGEWRTATRQLPELSPGRYEAVATAVDRFGVQ